MLLNVIIYLAALVTIFPTFYRAENKVCDPAKREMTNLWLIKTSPPSYLFGTIHVPYTLVWPNISQNAKKAFNISEKIFFESSDVSTSNELIENCTSLPDDQDLSKVLGSEDFKRLKKLVDSLPLSDAKKKKFIRLKPYWLRSESISDSITNAKSPFQYKQYAIKMMF